MEKLVFISHSSKEADTALALCRYLEENGRKCFIAPRDIRSGKEYAEEIVNGIDAAEVIVLLLSNNANESPHVLREVERGVSKSIPIIVYKLEDVRLSKSMEYFLMTHQWMDSNIHQTNDFSNILKSVNDIFHQKDRDVQEGKGEQTQTGQNEGEDRNGRKKNTIVGEMRLIEAVKTGNRALVKVLLEKFDGNINRKDSEGKSVLFYACEQGNLTMAELMLKKNADIEVMDNDGNTLLHAAVGSGNKPILKLLLDGGLYIDAKNNEGRTPLMTAAMKSRADIAKYLVEQGADIAAKDNRGNNAYKYAVTGGNKQLILLLMDDIEEKTKNGNNALHIAVASGSLEAVKAVAGECAELINEKNDEGETPIFLAAKNNQYVIMKNLVEKGADITQYDNQSRTVLHLSVLCNNLAGTQLLVEHGANIDALDARGNTPLLLAVEHRNAECAYYLLENGADTKAVNNAGKSVYDYAIQNHMTELVEML